MAKSNRVPTTAKGTEQQGTAKLEPDRDDNEAEDKENNEDCEAKGKEGKQDEELAAKKAEQNEGPT